MGSWQCGITYMYAYSNQYIPKLSYYKNAVTWINNWAACKFQGMNASDLTLNVWVDHPQHIHTLGPKPDAVSL